MTRKHASTVTVAAARARLAELLRRVEAGEEFVIARNRTPVARLVAACPPGPRRPGSARGLFTVAPDFDAPLGNFRKYRR